MCRIGAIKSKHYIHPSMALKLMRSQQEGHDNSGFAFVMQDLGGIFENYKELPILSMACTDEGMKYAEDLLHRMGFTRVFQYNIAFTTYLNVIILSAVVRASAYLKSTSC